MSALTMYEKMLQGMSPEHRLGVEVLRLALKDAQHAPFAGAASTRYGSWQARENAAFRAARAWFQYEAREVHTWLDLLGLPEAVYEQLRREATLPPLSPKEVPR